MIVRLVLLFLLTGRALSQSESCSTVSTCSKPYQVCRSGQCQPCALHSECISQHTVRLICADMDHDRCTQCTSNPDCTGSQVCVTDDRNYLCATTCAGPSATCTANSQCIYIKKDSSSGGNFYCLSCENDSDCRKWSGDSSSTCSSGKCSPAFVSCSQDSHCTSLTASDCTSNVCKPCSQDLHCTRFTDTPLCDSEKGKCVKCKTNANCTELSASECSSGNCVPCTSNTSCARFNSTPLCSDPSGGTCVQCVHDSDCPTEAAARCSESNTCVPCTGDSECSHFSDTKLCNDPTGASGGGKCVQCINHTNCTSPAKARCSSGTCDKCTANDQCARFNTTPVCSDLSGGTCVQCVHDSDCPTEAAAKCVSYACVPCTEDDQCARFNTTPVCSSHSGGTCVQCVHHSNCSSETAARCSESNTCVPCTGDSECSHFSDTKLCNDPTGASGGGKCVQCINHTNCTSPELAQCASNTCTTCTDSTQCTHLDPISLCNTTNGECVECLSITDCSDGKICSSDGACIPCTSSSECTIDPILLCNTTLGKCVQCNSDSDCPSATASQCSASNTCIPCDDSSHCAHFPDTTLCVIVGSSPGLCTPRCVTNCLQCLNDTACKVCLSGHYLLNTTACLTTCPDGYWKNDQTMTCDMCDSTCQTCDINANRCTSCFTPYVLDGSRCRSHGSPPTVTLKSSSNPEIFLLIFSRPMTVTPEVLIENLQFSFTNMSPSDYYLLNITAQPDEKTFKIIVNFTRSFGIETLTATFTNKKVISDKEGLIISQDSVSAQTIRFTFFTAEEKAAAESLTSVGSTVSNTALTSSMGMFFAGGGGMLWDFLGIFQVVNYLLFLNVNYPYNVIAFFKLFSVGSVNAMIPNPIQYVFPTLYEEMQAGLPSPPKFSDNDMDALYLNNAGSTLAGWIAVGVLYIFAKIMLSLFRTSGRFNRILTSFKEKFEWGIVYNAMIGTYPDLLIASCLQFANMDFTTSINKFSSITALIIGACCFWAPFTVTAALESSAEVLGTEFHEKKHGALYEGFIVESQKNVSPETAYYRRNFMAFIFLRKITYFSGIVLAYDIPILQMLITCCSGLVLLIFMIKVKPYRFKRDAWMNVGSELLMVMIHLVIFVFAGDDLTLKLTDTQRKNVGWVVIILCCLLVAYNALFIFAQQVLLFWRGLKLLMNLLCKKKKKAGDLSKSNYQKSCRGSYATTTNKKIKISTLNFISTTTTSINQREVRWGKLPKHCARKRRINLSPRKKGNSELNFLEE